MKRILEWTAIGLASIIVIAVLALFGLSEYRLRETFDIAAMPIVVPTDSASVARGYHVFRTRGCEGCHGPSLEGKVFFDEPEIARIVSPNVPKLLKDYSDADLARLLRHGVRPNGTGVAVMPSSMFYYLDDADLGALIAYLRTLPERDGPSLPPTSMRVLARIGLIVGEYKLEPRDMVHDAPRPPNGPEPAARGLYLAKTSCTECHGADFMGSPDTPALSIVAGYSPAEFTRLLRQGVPKDGRELRLMGGTARNRFANFTAEEVNALYVYLSQQLRPAASGGQQPPVRNR